MKYKTRKELLKELRDGWRDYMILSHEASRMQVQRDVLGLIALTLTVLLILALSK